MDNIRTLRFRLQTRRRTRCRRCCCRCLSCIGRPHNVQTLPHYDIRRCHVYCSFKKSMDHRSKTGLHFQPLKICLSEQKNKLFAHLHRSYHTVVVAHWQTLAYRLPTNGCLFRKGKCNHRYAIHRHGTLLCADGKLQLYTAACQLWAYQRPLSHRLQAQQPTLWYVCRTTRRNNLHIRT